MCNSLLKVGKTSNFYFIRHTFNNTMFNANQITSNSKYLKCVLQKQKGLSTIYFASRD